MKIARLSILILPVLLAFACDDPAQLVVAPEGGTGGTPTGGTGGTGRTTTLCESEPETADYGWQRLSSLQYRNTLNDVFTWLLGPAEGKAFLEKIKPDIDQIAPVHPRRIAQTLPPMSETEAEIGVAIVAAQLFATLPTVRLFEAMGAPAANESAVAVWVRQFAAQVGSRAFRTPLDFATVDDLASMHPKAAQIDMSALGQIVGVVLGSPEFLLRVEHGTDAVPGHPTSFQLSPFELASRLSYHIWNAPPDAPLMQAASDGSLLGDDVYEAQLARMLADPRARPTIRQFLYGMLELGSVADPAGGLADANYIAFAGADLPTPALRQRLIDEALDMGEYSFFEGENYATLLRVGRSFARTDDLARLYGAPVWDGQSAPPTLDNRPGLLSHGWVTVARGLYRRQMQMGQKLRETILCDEVPPPPPSFPPQPPVSTGLTGREWLEQNYQSPSCHVCHDIFATLAYPFEGYDALGRVRTQETVYDGTNAPAGTKPVNAQSVPRVMFDDDREADGAAQLVELMLESDKVFACLSKHLNTFAFPAPPATFYSEPVSQFGVQGALFAAPAPPSYPGPSPPLTNGSCAIDTIRDRARDATLLEAFAATAQLRAFTTRATDPPGP
jgi:Protein of unknown function (DUF1592)/Protein of unknown function (DUF1588)